MVRPIQQICTISMFWLKIWTLCYQCGGGTFQTATHNSEFAIYHVVRQGNVNSIQNPSTATNPTMEPNIVFFYHSRCCAVLNMTNRKLTIIFSHQFHYFGTPFWQSLDVSVYLGSTKGSVWPFPWSAQFCDTIWKNLSDVEKQHFE